MRSRIEKQAVEKGPPLKPTPCEVGKGANRMPRRGPRRPLPALVAGLALLIGCGSTALIRVAPPGAGLQAKAPPRIEKAIDLGGLPIQERGELTFDHSDQRFTPGEWVALVGQNLAASPKITFGGVEVPAAGYIEGGSILIRVPRGLAPGKQTISVTTAAGNAAIDVQTAFYVFGADTHGDRLRFRRIGGPGGFEEAALEITLEKARFSVLSPDGAILYAVQKPNLDTAGVPSKINSLLKVVKKVRGGDVKCTVLVAHLGGRNGPGEVRRLQLTLSSKPTGMAISPKKQLVILQKRKLTVLDLADPLQPRETTTLTFASKDQPRELIDAAFLEGGRWLAVLEAYENRVHLVDFANPESPRLTPGVTLSREVEQPFSIDLALQRDGKSMWILQGPNLRLAGKRLLDGLKALWQDVKKLEFKQGAAAAGAAVGSATMPPQEGLCRLVQVALRGSELQVVASIPLPVDLFPFFVQPDGQGSLYVSGINRSAMDFSKVDLSLAGLKQALGVIKNASQLGRVLKVSTKNGKQETVLQGVAIYYDLALLPTGKLLTSTVRFGPGYLPPRLTLDWGLEMPGKFTKLREVANTTFKLTDALKKLMPPYSYERIGSQ